MPTIHHLPLIHYDVTRAIDQRNRKEKKKGESFCTVCGSEVVKADLA
jgi:hypothetical protein